jgi:CheY-like chemotaxis protein
MSRILVIEDDRLLREWVEQILKQRGHQVDLAEGGREGLLKIKASIPDALVLDLLMPLMSGFEVLTALGKESIRVPTIITSGIVVPGVHDYLKTHEQVRILSKPYSADDLLQAIDELLEATGKRKRS